MIGETKTYAHNDPTDFAGLPRLTEKPLMWDAVLNRFMVDWGVTATKPEQNIVKEKTVVLKDWDNDPRVIVHFIETKTIGRIFTYWGIAIRSNQDNHDEDTGKRLAHARAVRALKGRDACYCIRNEAINNVHALRYEDFRKLMYLTDGQIKYFAKGDGSFRTIKEILKEWRNTDNI
jgi:hypothetical protein